MDVIGDPILIIADDPSSLARGAAGLFVRSAREGIVARGAFFAALSGGATPRETHRLLAQSPHVEAIPWKDTHLFWVDERCVAYTDPASNFGAAKKDFLSKIPMAEERIHPMPATVLPEDGATRYTKDLEAFLPQGPGGVPRFDLIFLGIGADGHTASLFPGQEPLEEQERWIVAVKGGNPGIHRLTMTLPVLNGGRQIIFLVSGKDKAPVVRKILEKEEVALPAGRVRPVDGQVTWLLDAEAASMLSKEVCRGAL
jgi:6-phosphogluconolactonase